MESSTEFSMQVVLGIIHQCFNIIPALRNHALADSGHLWVIRMLLLFKHVSPKIPVLKV